MRWNDYIVIHPEVARAAKTSIPVKQLGIKKVIRVRTKQNGDL